MFSELIHTGICDFSLPYLQIVNLNAIIIIIFCRQTLRENVIKYLNALLFLPPPSLSLSKWNETYSECFYCFIVATDF